MWVRHQYLEGNGQTASVLTTVTEVHTKQLMTREIFSFLNPNVFSGIAPTEYSVEKGFLIVNS